MNRHIVEKMQICQGFLPVDMRTAANTGDWVSMKGYFRCAVVFFKSPGTAGDDPTITLLQALDVSGGSSKALNITRVDKKQAATNLLSTGTYTNSTSASPASHDAFSTDTWTNTDLAEQAAIVVIDIDQSDLDIANGFCCIQASVGDVGTNAQLGCMLYLLHDPRNEKQTLDSAIVN
jgi:hypothetical protein